MAMAMEMERASEREREHEIGIGVCVVVVMLFVRMCLVECLRTNIYMCLYDPKAFDRLS